MGRFRDSLATLGTPAPGLFRSLLGQPPQKEEGVRVPPGFEPIQHVSKFEFGRAALADITAGPFVGIAERIGLITPGVREALREDFEKKRIDFLAEDPSAGRFAFTATAEGLANLLPLVPGGALGRAAAKVAKGGAAAKAIKGATAGAGEGFIIGVGDAPLVPEEHRGKFLLQATGLGGLAGAAGGLAVRESAQASGFAEKYRADEPDVASTGLERIRRLHDMLQESFFNDRVAVEKVARRFGDSALDSMTEVVQRARVSRRASMNPVFRRTEVWDPRNRQFVHTGEPLAEITKDLGPGVYEDLQDYLLARRELELGARSVAGDDIKVSQEAQEDALAKIRALTAKYGTTPDGHIQRLDDAAFRYREWSKRAILVPLRAVGVLSDADVERILGKNEHHAIFSRVERHFAGAGRRGRPIKRISEGLSKDNKVRPPIEEAAFFAARVSELVDRQLVKRELVELAERSPGLVPEISKSQKKVRKVAELTLEERQRLGITEGDVAGSIFRAVDHSSAGDSFVMFRDGQREVWDAPENILRAVEGMAPLEARLAVRSGEVAAQMARVATLPAKTLRTGATAALGFALRNPVRDNLTAFIHSRHGFIPFYEPVRQIVTELASVARTRQPSQFWQEFMDSGTSGATLVGLDRATLAAETRAAKRLGVRGKMKHFFSEWLGNPIYPFQVLSEFSEKLTRVGEFRLARQGGRKTIAGLPIPGTRGEAPATTLRAARDAAEVTLNFSRAGTFGRSWNAFEPFINAELQDFSKVIRTFKEKPFEAGMRAASLITMPVLANWALNKNDPDYQQRPEYEKGLFLHVTKNRDRSFGLMARPIGMLNVIFGQLPEAAADELYAKIAEEQGTGAAERFREGLVDQTPIGMLVSPARALQSATPAILEPLAENFYNYDLFFKRNIVPKRLQDELPKDQFTAGTPEVARQIGKALGQSPLKVQNIIDGYLGTLGRDVERLVGVAGFGEELVPTDPQIGLRGAPVVGGAIRAFRSGRAPAGFQSKQVADLFDLRDEAIEAQKLLDDANTIEEKLGVLVTRPEALFLKELHSSTEWLSQQSKLRRQIMQDSELPDDERAHLALSLDQAISTVSAAAMKTYSEAVVEARRRIEEGQL